MGIRVALESLFYEVIMLTHQAETLVSIQSAEDLAALTRERVASGQQELSRAMRSLVARVEPEIASAIEDAPDAAFLEPLLFSYFAAGSAASSAEPVPSMGLAQLLFGGLPKRLRPDAIEVLADSCGRIYVPSVGCFITDQPFVQAILHWDRATDRCSLERDHAHVPFRFEPIRRLPGTRIELLGRISPLLETRFVNTCGHRTDPSIDPQLERRADEIASALRWLAVCAPDYLALLAQVTRQVCVFGAPQVNSFASIHAHGTAFFNTAVAERQSPPDAVFFYDELVHQCGHVIFNALTVKRRDFLAIDPETPLRLLSPEESDRRTVYDALHGLYTEHMMSACMLALERRSLLCNPRQAHELHGRLSFIAHKYCVDLQNLAGSGVFTALGRELYDYFRRSCVEMLRARPDLLACDMRGQPYNFDYALFASRNPLRAADVQRRA